jgi:hypothetical protein
VGNKEVLMTTGRLVKDTLYDLYKAAVARIYLTFFGMR